MHYHVGNPRWEPKDLGYTILLYQYTTTYMNNECFAIFTLKKKSGEKKTLRNSVAKSYRPWLFATRVIAFSIIRFTERF